MLLCGCFQAWPFCIWQPIGGHCSLCLHFCWLRYKQLSSYFHTTDFFKLFLNFSEWLIVRDSFRSRFKPLVYQCNGIVCNFKEYFNFYNFYSIYFDPLSSDPSYPFLQVHLLSLHSTFIFLFSLEHTHTHIKQNYT